MRMEFQLLGRLSFQRLAGLHTGSQIPGRTTIWMFKERLIKAGASETVFDAVNRQLSRHGYMARGGQMIGASTVQAPKQSIKKDEKDIVAEQTTRSTGRQRSGAKQDVEARWTKKHGKSYFGY